MGQQYFISIGPLVFATEKTCRATILRGHTDFVINVEIARIKDTNLGKKLLQQMEVWKEGPYTRANNNLLFDPIYQHCLPLLERLAPQTSLEDLSLESFLHSPTYNLELVHDGVGDDVRIKGEDECLYTPAFATSPMPTADLPEPRKVFPFFHARDISIAPIIDAGKSLDAIQGRVVTAEGVAMYFKPRFDMREQDFERELCILSRIDEAGLAARLRVPKLHGIVVSGEHGEMAVGMLMTLVTSSEIGTHLRSPGLRSRYDLHRKWEEQVTNIVKELHAHGIVWGDVHPMNILVDEAMDAWAIDFGGMNNVAFIDDEKRETVEGDWQGVTRVFRDWLPNPQAWSQW